MLTLQEPECCTRTYRELLDFAESLFTNQFPTIKRSSTCCWLNAPTSWITLEKPLTCCQYWGLEFAGTPEYLGWQTASDRTTDPSQGCRGLGVRRLSLNLSLKFRLLQQGRLPPLPRELLGSSLRSLSHREVKITVFEARKFHINVKTRNYTSEHAQHIKS